MIGLNDALDGKTTLTVKKGKMTVHVPMKGTGLTKAFVGTAKSASKKGARTIKGKKEKVGGDKVLAFDIPVCFWSKRRKRWYQKSVKVTYNP